MQLVEVMVAAAVFTAASGCSLQVFSRVASSIEQADLRLVDEGPEVATAPAPAAIVEIAVVAAINVRRPPTSKFEPTGTYSSSPPP